MSAKPMHLQWLVDTKERLKTSDGKTVQVWELCHQPNEQVLSDWAKHFREHYCLDSEIDFFRQGTGYSRADYLNIIKFPDRSASPGPSIRAGDFGEILIDDFLEYVLELWVPRVRYGAKVIGNESSKGCDTLGFQFLKAGEESPRDLLAVFETKARLTQDKVTEDKKVSGFQAAINDSAKDQIRQAESLNYVKQQLYYRGDAEGCTRIERFQNIDDHPYQQLYGAAAIFSIDSFIPETISSATVSTHPKPNSLLLMIIKGENLMDLVHELYRRAADEA